MHFLTGLLPPCTLGAGFTFDLRTFAFERYEVPREPDCQVCGLASRQTGPTPAER